MSQIEWKETELAATPSTWAEFAWPAWIPQQLREHIADFWREEWGRGPRAWVRDMDVQGAPLAGSRCNLLGVCSLTERHEGRYVHAWNNIGWVVKEHEPVACVSFLQSEGRRGS